MTRLLILQVVERYTRTAPNDPEIFERPFQPLGQECEIDVKGVFRRPQEFLKELTR